MVLGEHLFGTCTLGEEAGTFRGGMLEYDAPRVIGWDEGAVKTWLADPNAGPIPDNLNLIDGTSRDPHD